MEVFFSDTEAIREKRGFEKLRFELADNPTFEEQVGG
jgi:hypothetical protein